MKLYRKETDNKKNKTKNRIKIKIHLFIYLYILDIFLSQKRRKSGQNLKYYIHNFIIFNLKRNK